MQKKLLRPGFPKNETGELIGRSINFAPSAGQRERFDAMVEKTMASPSRLMRKALEDFLVANGFPDTHKE